MPKWFSMSLLATLSFAWTTLVHAQIKIEATGLYETAKGPYNGQKNLDLGSTKYPRIT